MRGERRDGREERRQRGGLRPVAEMLWGRSRKVMITVKEVKKSWSQTKEGTAEKLRSVDVVRGEAQQNLVTAPVQSGHPNKVGSAYDLLQKMED
ncbi:hypothetical protein IRJ41_008525 [Triplophysa rosa]|uniref:Uncharacterized protein n=1 Tax=Triplophysa rosa TaxID=992332 RepID=A0A9W7WSQ0_TRIRA|nr:hypothetical protein IRJ41_008525 [Triplophysa rosa]